MTQLRKTIHYRVYVTILALLLLAVPVFGLTSFAEAGFLNDRTITIGNSAPSAVTTHGYTFNIESSAVVGSIKFQYCDNSPLYGLPCNPPAGLGLATVVLSSQSGATGFTSTASANPNEIVISRPPSLATPGPVSYMFSNIVNPSTPNMSFYVRLQTYASIDGTGSPIDTGAVVFSTSGSFNTRAYVPPFLTFCVGVTVAQDCSSMTGNFIDFGELSSSSTKTATTQFSAATNVDLGYIVAFIGTPLTSGNNVMPTNTSPTSSSVDRNQFGFNLRANSNPGVGSDPTGPGTGTPTPNYNIPNKFAFNDGDVIADSTITTDFTRFTVSYIVNIDKTQAPGVYTTTNTYLATAQF